MQKVRCFINSIRVNNITKLNQNIFRQEFQKELKIKQYIGKKIDTLKLFFMVPSFQNINSLTEKIYWAFTNIILREYVFYLWLYGC